MLVSRASFSSLRSGAVVGTAIIVAQSAEHADRSCQPSKVHWHLPDRDNGGRALKLQRRFSMQVGKPAPEFTLQAYHKGETKEISLSDYKGQWVVVCFYPADFTFV